MVYIYVDFTTLIYRRGELVFVLHKLQKYKVYTSTNVYTDSYHTSSAGSSNDTKQVCDVNKKFDFIYI